MKGCKMKFSKMLLVFMCALVMAWFSGCVKKPLVEKFEEVKNNETAFVIQLEGSAQAKLDSLEALQKMQISEKRINIPQRWMRTGRWEHEGDWIPTVKVLKVDRSPVSREWSEEPDTGTSKKNEAIWVESKDSIGFSTGFNCTAMIKEENSAKFLYLYPNGSLTTIMDSQIRNEIQAVASEAAAAWKMDECREKKLEIIAAVREKVIPKFEATGITITTIGMFGGFKYEDKEIQNSINNTFVAQQEKIVSAAQLVAQTDKNKTIEMAAVGLKNSAITKSQGEAEALKIKAQAEAEAVRVVAEAASKAGQSETFIQLKRIEVEMNRLNKWNGQYPQWVTGDTGEKIGMFVNPTVNPIK
jgi:hypothetical protein